MKICDKRNEEKADTFSFIFFVFVYWLYFSSGQFLWIFLEQQLTAYFLNSPPPLISLLTDICCLLLWLLSIIPRMSYSLSLCANLSQTVPNTLVMTDTIVAFMFHNFPILYSYFLKIYFVSLTWSDTDNQ